VAGYQKLLTLAGAVSLLVAVFQAVISFFPALSLYYGAPEWIVADWRLLLAVGLAAAVVFAVFGLYGLSGAGIIRRLPWLRTGLTAVGLIYTLRGLAVIPVVLIRLGVVQVSAPLDEPALISAIIPLVIGLLYLGGVKLGWRDLAATRGGR
jgi:hypothetical protein